MSYRTKSSRASINASPGEADANAPGRSLRAAASNNGRTSFHAIAAPANDAAPVTADRIAR
ncbi:MAG: hypothetical protein FJX59_21435 [Alphaproteobacteria bacterium]|nr:hypothetical protein [Alphaproteobacteria bacterium]